MVPIGTLVKVDQILGPQTILRYNLYPSASITGEASAGFSSGQALNLMEQMADRTLPASMGYEWTGMSFQEKKVGSEAIMVFVLAIVLVFLVLAAQYESWSNPVAVILVVPLAVLGTVLALVMRGFDNNVYTQIGIVLLIGLASKNAILIVEFAMAEREKGKRFREAAMDAAKLRFRPILMTAISSIAGFMPLVVAAGAGAASRQAIGTAVVGGMVAATIMSLLFTPVFYVVMQKLAGFRKKKPETGQEVKKGTVKQVPAK
jgi:HAE1 family hydrophobic/amphiphilic exporter-1